MEEEPAIVQLLVPRLPTILLPSLITIACDVPPLSTVTEAGVFTIQNLRTIDVFIAMSNGFMGNIKQLLVVLTRGRPSGVLEQLRAGLECLNGGSAAPFL